MNNDNLENNSQRVNRGVFAQADIDLLKKNFRFLCNK